MSQDKQVLNKEFIDPFILAAVHVLKVQAQVESKSGSIQNDTNKDLTGDISGVMGIVTESFNGSVVISFPESTFLKIMSNMLGEEYTELNQDIVDGAGELTNMIFGQSKIVLNERGLGISTALPTVVVGKGHSLSAMKKGEKAIIPFESNVGNFFIEICVE